MTTSTFLEIDIGLTANDGTGDPIRDAFDKVNKNFATLFTSTSLVTISGINLVDLGDTPKAYSLTVPPVNGVVVLTSDNIGTYTNKFLYGSNDIDVTQSGTNVVISHLYTATTASIANTLVLRDSSGNIFGGGYAGSVGFTGSIGSIGFTGSTGVGFTGSQGSGFAGSVGFVGSIGFTGSVGPVGPGGGPAGPPGYDGSAGFIGSVGFTGSIGFTGSAGSGFTGSAGSGFTGSAGGPTVYISVSPPGSPATGDFWAVPL